MAQGERAFALVTAGPGLTNIVTAMAGAFLESRELLVIGGQVKISDLSHGEVRQRGIQEVDGVSIAEPMSVLSRRIDDVLARDEFRELAEAGSFGRKGPVFLELPLDIQARSIDPTVLNSSQRTPRHTSSSNGHNDDAFAKLARIVRDAERPILLIGGGVSRRSAAALHDRFATMALPIMTHVERRRPNRC